MSDENKIENLRQTLRQKKDEIHLKVHLASMEIAEEWDKAQQKFDVLEAEISKISSETKSAGQDLLSSIEKLGAEVDQAFDRIKSHLK
jgi:multidrug resistance efflux pump